MEITASSATCGILQRPFLQSTGGYIWHTTGSGKTLTSFKTAQLAARLSHIDKVLFVVDRKDLDYQTMKKYDRFEKGAANSNTSTKVLQKQLEDSASRIIITTIQKLGLFIKKNKGHEAFQKHIVLIFDECHRSQFGEMHALVVKHFKKYHMFGFTGTPIFAANAAVSGNPHLKTTPQAFGDKLHTYTIVNAINDGNVLPFRIDYVNTIKARVGIEDAQISTVDRERTMAAPDRIASVVRYILEHFEQKTKRNEFYSLKGQRIAGFNSIFAVSSIPVAMQYYAEFKKQHGLIQTYSRTNRILNSVKTYGNIVCFRDLQKATDDAISLFGDKDAESIVLLQSFDDYYHGYEEQGRDYPDYSQLVEQLQAYPLGEPITGEENQKDFVRLFGTVLKLRNVLTSFDAFSGNEIMAASELQDYQSLYIDLYNEFKSDEKADKENINDDLVFELELIRQVEINIDYILMLVSISKAINSSMQLRSKKELIEAFINTVNADTKVDEDWKTFVTQQKDEDLDTLIMEEKLKPEEARTYVNNSLRDGTLKTTGTDFDRLMPPVSRFGGGRDVKKERIIEKVMKFFEKYQGIISG